MRRERGQKPVMSPFVAAIDPPLTLILIFVELDKVHFHSMEGKTPSEDSPHPIEQEPCQNDDNDDRMREQTVNHVVSVEEHGSSNESQHEPEKSCPAIDIGDDGSDRGKCPSSC
jgi:hypothetical protein